MWSLLLLGHDLQRVSRRTAAWLRSIFIFTHCLDLKMDALEVFRTSSAKGCDERGSVAPGQHGDFVCILVCRCRFVGRVSVWHAIALCCTIVGTHSSGSQPDIQERLPAQPRLSRREWD